MLHNSVNFLYFPQHNNNLRSCHQTVCQLSSVCQSKQRSHFAPKASGTMCTHQLQYCNHSDARYMFSHPFYDKLSFFLACDIVRLNTLTFMRQKPILGTHSSGHRSDQIIRQKPVKVRYLADTAINLQEKAHLKVHLSLLKTVLLHPNYPLVNF